MSALAVLLQAKWRTLANYRRSDHGGGHRLVVFALLGLAVWAGIYGSAHWFLERVLAVEPVGVVMVRRLLNLVLVFVFSILTISNLIAAFSTFFLADDLQLLVARPIPTYALFSARWAENAVYASWMTVTFSIPVFVATGVVMDAAWPYYVELAIIVVFLALVCTSLAVAVALVLGRLLSATRSRQILAVLATIVFVVLFVLFRNLEPERFVDPDQRAPLLDVLQQIQGADPPWLPTTWAMDALWAHLGWAPDSQTHPLLLLATGSATAFFVAAWVFRGVYAAAFSRAQEGTARSFDDQRKRRDLATLEAQAQRRSGHRSLRATIARKDVRVFLRDTAQWSQLLLLSALVVVYVVNFRYIRSAGESGIISLNGMHFINVALGGFVAVAVCVRFAFPAVSLEGNAFWILLRSPNRMIEILRAKWFSLGIPLWLLVTGLVVITSLWLGSGAARTIVAAITIGPLVLGSSALALGLGARYPRFGIDNAAKIATGFGGVLYMFSGLALLLVTVLLSVAPTLVLSQWLSHAHLPSPTRMAGTIVSAVASLVTPFVVGWWALRRGARHLERKGLNA